MGPGIECSALHAGHAPELVSVRAVSPPQGCRRVVRLTLERIRYIQRCPPENKTRRINLTTYSPLKKGATKVRGRRAILIELRADIIDN